MPSSRVLLLITGSYPPAVCGVGDYTAALARAVARAGHWQVRVATAADATASEDDRRAGVSVVPLFNDWSLPHLPSTVRQLRALNADLVHMQLPTQGYGSSVAPWLLPASLALRGQHVVQTWHEYIPGPYSLRPLAAATAGHEVIVVRPSYAEKIPPLHRLVMGRANVTLIRNASNIPVTRFAADERAELRTALAGEKRRLVGYFGFAYPHKRVELLFELLDPDTTMLLIIGRLDRANPYHHLILERMDAPRWRASVQCTGFVTAERAADLLAACDAVVLPFADGGGDWNTSLHAVQSQGTFLVTTSTTRAGYQADENTFYAAPSDVEGMRRALVADAFPRTAPRQHGASWEDVARAHEVVYERALGSRR